MNGREAFIPYWQAYASEVEAYDKTKRDWSEASRTRGIALRAAEGLTGVLAGESDRKVELCRADDDGWRSSELVLPPAIRCRVLVRDPAVSHLGTDWIRGVEEFAREALCVVILPSCEYAIYPGSARSVTRLGALAIGAYPSDIDALASRHCDFWDWIGYKLWRRIVLGRPEAETAFERQFYDEYSKACIGEHPRSVPTLAAVLESWPEDYRQWVDHPSAQESLRALEGGRGCLLVGASASGKTALAVEIGNTLRLQGRAVNYAALGQYNGVGREFVTLLLRGESGSVLIADDLQSNPTMSRMLLAVAGAARRARGLTAPLVVATSWPEYAEEAAAWQEECLLVPVRAEQISGRLVRRYADRLSAADLESVKEQFGSDLVLLRLGLERSTQLRRTARGEEVVEELWRHRTKGMRSSDADARKTAVVTASLGRYDIAAPGQFVAAEARVGGDVIEDLLSTGLLRRFGAAVSLGHRSVASLIGGWLESHGGWDGLIAARGPKSPSDVALDYLRSQGTALAVDVLRALQARAGFRDRPRLSRSAAALVEVWDAFNAVVERIERQEMLDPTWGNSLSSATFAVQSLVEVGKRSLTRDSLAFLRGHWRLKSGVLELLTEGLGTASDFEKIRECMATEDKLERVSRPHDWMMAEMVDVDRFHRTWLGGLILCAEAAASQDARTPSRLADAMEAQQLEDGAFYPRRVPWSTGRVLLGLGACGRKVENSLPVRRAVDWLLRDRAEGGASQNGLWEGGTGTWNSVLETTAMIVIALLAVGLPSDDRRLSPAKSFLRSAKSEWATPGHELDGAQAVQASLELGTPWEEVAREAQQLSMWARGEALWRTATLSAAETLQESCRVAQIAQHLVHIGWTAIRTDLPVFLDALDVPKIARRVSMKAEGQAAGTTAALATTAPPPTTTIDAELALLESLDELHLDDYTVVGSYRRFHPATRSRLRDWSTRIAGALRRPSGGHENFLVWGPPGSGKTSFVRSTAAACADIADHLELNLAADGKVQAEALLNALSTRPRATLVTLDEVDARPDELWPCEISLPILDINLKGGPPCVVVAAASGFHGMQSLIEAVQQRNKGRDFLDRLPADRRFEIPAASKEDLCVLLAGFIRAAGEARGVAICEVERLVFYYVLKTPGLHTPRQLEDFATYAVRRLTESEKIMRYDDLFFRGDRRNQDFWVLHQSPAAILSGLFVRVS